MTKVFLQNVLKTKKLLEDEYLVSPNKVSYVMWSSKMSRNSLIFIFISNINIKFPLNRIIPIKRPCPPMFFSIIIFKNPLKISYYVCLILNSSNSTFFRVYIAPSLVSWHNIVKNYNYRRRYLLRSRDFTLSSDLLFFNISISAHLKWLT